MILLSDTIRDTLPYYLKAEVDQAVPESWQVCFGQYDFFTTDSSRLFFDFDEGMLSSLHSLPAGSVGVVLPFSPWVQSVFFLLFLFNFMVFAFIFRWGGTALKGNFKRMFTLRKQTIPVRKSQVTKVEAWGELFLLQQTILIFSVLLFSWLWSNRGLPAFPMEVQVVAFVVVFAGFALLFYLKIGGYRLIGTFFLPYAMKRWITGYTRMTELFGIAFFLPAVFYVYLQEVRNIIAIGLLVVFFISRLVISIELLNIFVKNKINLFYFFVYLCGIEIAPYLLLYKGVLFAINFVGDKII